MRSKKAKKNRSRDIVYEELKQRRTLEFSRIDALETKAGFIMITSLFTSVLFQLVIGEIKTLVRPTMGFIFALISLCFSLAVILIKSYRIDPKINALIENYLRENPEITKDVLISNYRDSIEENSKTIEKKVEYTKLSLGFLVAEIVFYLLTLFTVVY